MEFIYINKVLANEGIKPANAPSSPVKETTGSEN
jgi:hypothetical protein